MFTRNVFILGAALFLCGCATYEGLYAPSCLAYSGSEIRLVDGRYVWNKFTDQVVVDEHGDKVDPFPGFPREGAYAKQGDRITLGSGASGEPDTMYLVEHNAEFFLYTAAEAKAFEATGKRPACPLKLQPPD
jgi:hypothetical protein